MKHHAFFILFPMLLMPCVLLAQTNINLPGISIRSGKVDVQGITIINGQLWIDNDEVPRGKKTHTSSKTGKSYKIEWEKGNNIAVSEMSK